MIKIALTGIQTELLDCSTMTERDYVQSDTEIILSKWNTNPAISYFEKSEASVMLSKLPFGLQKMFRDFEVGLINYLQAMDSNNN